MKIALAQYALEADTPANLRKVLAGMEQAAGEGASLILFPELCLSPFFPRCAGQDASGHAVKIDAECILQMQSKCRELGIAASPNVYLEDEARRRFDASLMIDSRGELQGISKMVHIAQLPGFYEQDYYMPSDTGFHVFDIGTGKIGIVVCFDRHFPESIRTCTLRGAELILIPTANTMDEPRDLFECELRTAALQNGVYIAMCNRVGREGDTVFCGESMVVDCFGNVIFKAADQEAPGIAEIDLSQIERARTLRPYLQLRRPETYD